MDDLTQQLANFATEIRFSDLPGAVVHEIKRLLLDSLGCAMGGTRMEHGKISVEIAKKLGGPPESTLLGTSSKVSSINAAFANGELIGAQDYDAILGPHIPPYVLPAPLALGEAVSASGKVLILSIVLGLEITRRLQMATSSSFRLEESGPERGKLMMPPVSGQGPAVFGAAVGSGKILNLNHEKMAHAIGIAGYAGPPNTAKKGLDTSPTTMTKHGTPGFTAEVGLRAALLADMGYYGDTHLFEGEFGYWRFTGFEKWDKDIVTKGLGNEWMCTEISYKKYPCGG
jgi:2-methylcitrate dehydratase PrpD